MSTSLPLSSTTVITPLFSSVMAASDIVSTSATALKIFSRKSNKYKIHGLNLTISIPVAPL